MTAHTTYRAARLHDAGDIRIETLSLPTTPLPPGHIAIRPRFCGICGSDLHMYFNPLMAATLKTPHPLTHLSLPVTFGHEFSGTVLSLGPDSPSSSHQLAVGDNVAIMPTISDQSCNACSLGATNVCSSIGFVGLNSHGGMGDYVVVPESMAFRLPGGVGLDVGALVEPLAVAWHAVSLVGEVVSPASSVVVIGGGPVGAAVLLVLKARGVKRIYVSEPSEEKREFCMEIGALAVVDPEGIVGLVEEKTDKVGVDVAFDCAGVAATLETAVTCVRALGTIVNLAIQAKAEIPLLAMVMKEVVFRCSLAYTSHDFGQVIEAVSNGTLKPERLITKRIRLEDVAHEGLEALHDKSNKECKILVDMDL